MAGEGASSLNIKFSTGYHEPLKVYDDIYNALPSDVKLSNVEIVDEMNKTSYVTVFKGIWSGKDVCIKMFSEECVPELVYTEMYHNLTLSHPNIVKTYGICKINNLVGIVMEMGGSSTNYRDIICGIARGLAYLHSKFIAHLDVKLHNTIIVDGVPKLIDFGLIFGNNKYLKYYPGLTVRYAPYKRLTTNTKSRMYDVYSFGCLIFDLICTKRSWDWLPKQTLEEQAALLAVDSLSNYIDRYLKPDIEDYYVELCRKCLCFRKTITAVSNELDGVLTHTNYFAHKQTFDDKTGCIIVPTKQLISTFEYDLMSNPFISKIVNSTSFNTQYAFDLDYINRENKFNQIKTYMSKIDLTKYNINLIIVAILFLSESLLYKTSISDMIYRSTISCLDDELIVNINDMLSMLQHFFTHYCDIEQGIYYFGSKFETSYGSFLTHQPATVNKQTALDDATYSFNIINTTNAVNVSFLNMRYSHIILSRTCCTIEHRFDTTIPFQFNVFTEIGQEKIHFDDTSNC